MLWLLFALLTALFTSLYDLSAKRILKQSDPLITAWSWSLFSSFFLIPLLFFIQVPSFGPWFWPVLALDTVLNILAMVFYMSALKTGDLSLTIPILSFTPALMFITSPLILREFPPPLGIFGISLIVLGSYLLNVKEYHKGFLEPFRALFRSKGARSMAIVAILWSMVANIEKLGIQQSSTLFWAITIEVAITATMLPIVFIFARDALPTIPKNFSRFALLGLFTALSVIFFMMAISHALVPYVIAIKRLSILLSVGWGYYFFKEQGIKERFTAAAFMVLGVILIAFS